MYIVHDIETIPETELTPLYLEAKEKHAEISPSKPFFPPIWAHKVISIGMLALDKNLHPTKGGCAAGGHAASEHQKITRWSEVTENAGRPHKLVDWNGKAFDLPVLQTRAFALGVPLAWYFQAPNPANKWSKPYRNRYAGQHLDLADEWTNNRAFQKPSLLHLATLMGLPGKVGIDGSKVHEAYQQGRHEEIDIYCMQDVVQTAFIFQRYSYLSGDLSLIQYQAATKSLLEWTADQPTQSEFIATINQDKLLLR